MLSRRSFIQGLSVATLATTVPTLATIEPQFAIAPQQEVLPSRILVPGLLSKTGKYAAVIDDNDNDNCIHVIDRCCAIDLDEGCFEVLIPQSHIEPFAEALVLSKELWNMLPTSEVAWSVEEWRHDWAKYMADNESPNSAFGFRLYISGLSIARRRPTGEVVSESKEVRYNCDPIGEHGEGWIRKITRADLFKCLSSEPSYRTFRKASWISVA